MIQQQLDKYINDPRNPQNNYWLGWEYEKLGHNAAALSYYLRCAELSEDRDLIYESLLKTWYVIHKATGRLWYEHQQLLTAITQHPKRPEAYFLLSRYHELKKQWKEAYYYASAGLELCDLSLPKTLTDVSYPGDFGLFFQKALSSWYVGQREESKSMFLQLYEDKTITPTFRRAIINNLIFFNIITFNNSPIPYNPSYSNKLKIPFKGCKSIETNHSQVMQDIFTLTVTDGKKDGTYLEIGCGEPLQASNTALLEKLGWNGLSLDISKSIVKTFNKIRKNKAIHQDGLKANYKELFKKHNLPKDITYLSLDCDPPEVTYNILTKLPLDEYKFAVITYEHDYWNDDEMKHQKLSQEYLESKGYKLVVNNIGASEYQSFEDWYIHPDLIEIDRIKPIININNKIKLPKDIFSIN